MNGSIVSSTFVFDKRVRSTTFLKYCSLLKPLLFIYQLTIYSKIFLLLSKTLTFVYQQIYNLITYKKNKYPAPEYEIESLLSKYHEINFEHLQSMPKSPRFLAPFSITCQNMYVFWHNFMSILSAPSCNSLKVHNRYLNVYAAPSETLALIGFPRCQKMYVFWHSWARSYGLYLDWI